MHDRIGRLKVFAGILSVLMIAVVLFSGILIAFYVFVSAPAVFRFYEIPGITPITNKVRLNN